ncbi:unnamed protein product [Jaminaea pallidilutea]
MSHHQNILKHCATCRSSERALGKHKCSATQTQTRLRRRALAAEMRHFISSLLVRYQRALEENRRLKEALSSEPPQTTASIW